MFWQRMNSWQTFNDYERQRKVNENLARVLNLDFAFCFAGKGGGGGGAGRGKAGQNKAGAAGRGAKRWANQIKN